MRVKKNKLTQATPPDEPYTNIEMRLVCADSIRIRNTGEVITWKPDMFRVYLYMFNQIKGFEASGGKFFQKREKIWKCCGVSRDRLDKILKSLLKLGLIKDTGERRTAPGAPRGMVVYTAFRLMDVIGNLEIIFADDDGEPVWNHERASGKEATTTQASSVDEPADQSPDLASESAASTVEHQSGMASDDDGSSDDRAAGNHQVRQKQKQDPFPWRGATFIKKRLSENAYQWALTVGATDWHHAYRLVLDEVGVTPPTEIDECYKPLSLC